MINLRLNPYIQNSSVSQQRVFINNEISRRFFSHNNHNFLGVPESPLPGSNAYVESMQRLKDPRVLESLSKKTIHPSSSLENIMNECMKEISRQNAVLIDNVKILTQKVEQLSCQHAVLIDNIKILTQKVQQLENIKRHA